MNTKKLISILLTIVIMVTATMSFNIVNAESKVKIELFGEIVTLPEGYGNPFIDSTTNRTLVPARGLFEAIGATVNWSAETRTVTVSKENLEIKVTLDSTLAYKNTTAIVLDQPPVIVGDRTYVPLRFIAESLDLNVDFNGETTTVIIAEKKKKTASAEGVYQVGNDIDSTEYLFVASKDATKGNIKAKLLRGEDSTKAENVITSIDFKDSVYISLIGCNYVELIGCTAHSLDALPGRVTNGSCENGMYKIGKDIEPGTYAVSRVDSKQAASYKIYYFPFSTSGTNKTVSEASISVNKNITLKKGQYILLDNAKLTKLETASSGSSGGGGGGSGSSGSRPIVVPSATATPTATPSPQPTHIPGTPTDVPTAEPTAVPTTNPNISTEEFFADFDGNVYDFGNCFSIPVLYKEEIPGELIIYTYDITDSALILNDSLNVDYLRSAYGNKFISDGFEEIQIPSETTDEYSLYNRETGLWVKCLFYHDTYDGNDAYSFEIFLLYNMVNDNPYDELEPPEIEQEPEQE